MNQREGELEAFSISRNETWRKLPKSHGYWAAKFLIPKMRAVFDCVGIDDFYLSAFSRIRNPQGRLNLLSLGSGLCIREQQLAINMKRFGFSIFIQCTEMSPERVSVRILSPISSIGAMRLRATSVASAFKGEM